MKKYMLWLLVIALFCAVTAGGCGGGHDDNFVSDDSEDTAYFGDETDTESGDETVPEDDEGRGGFSSGTIKVKVDGPTAYYFEAVAFYARKNGGKWEALHSKTGDQFKIVDRNFELDVSKEYVEFGFEFSVVWGTTYPYSGVFWTAKDTARIQPEKIDIDIGGTTLNTTIKIKVNDFQVFKDTNCSEKTRYGWEGIRMELSPSQLYSVKGAILYGRTSTSSNWVKVIEFNDDSTKRYRNATYLADGVTQEKKEDGKDTNGNQLYNYYHTYHIPENRYVEFAFECDIIGGTDYPYSDVFWTASQSASEAPHSIKIDLSGAVRNANIAIEVNNKTVFKETNLPAGKQRDWSKKDEIRVRLYKTGLYTCKSRAFYARKAGGSWECLFNTANSDHDIYISKEYVEFGFEFDIFWGTTWPYSDVFWSASDSAREKVRDIYIYTGGTSLNASIEIRVNNKEKVKVGDCSSHSQHYWKTWDGIKVTIRDTGAFTTEHRKFYARKPGGGWGLHASKDSGNPLTFYISEDYVDFGFEFDISGGTTWPYSGEFWHSWNGEAGEIAISIWGAVRNAGIEIKVNGNTVFYDGDCYSGSRHSW